MSGFALKTSLRKAIVTEDIFYDSPQKVYEFLSEKMKVYERKIYECLEISSEQPKKQIKIRDNIKCHVISYFPSGEIQIKEEICSCDFCCDGSFINCEDRTTGPKGRVHKVGKPSDSDFDDDSDANDFGEFDDEFEQNDIEQKQVVYSH